MKEFLRKLFHRKPKVVVIDDYEEWLAMLGRELG